MSQYDEQDEQDKQDVQDEGTDVEGHVKPEGEDRHFLNESAAEDDDAPDVEGHRKRAPRRF